MRTFSVTGLVLLTAMVGGAPTRAQNSLTGTVIAGPSAADVRASPLVTGRRVQSSASSPTEIAFSDGTSIVLGPDADVTIESLVRDEAGRWVLTGTSNRGRLRILAADKTAVALHTPAGDLRLAGTSVVVEGGANGSVTLLSAGKVEVRHDGRTDVLERAGFRLPFSGGGFERAATPQMATTVTQFAPVEKPVGTVGRPPQQIACPAGLSQRDGRRGSDQTDASCVVSKAAYVPSQDQTITYNSNQSVTQGLQSGIGGENNGQPFALARAQLSQESASGSSLSPPGANSNNSFANAPANIILVDGNGNRVTVAQAVTGIVRTQFGTGRVRRFAAGASGFPSQSARVDTGVVSFGSQLSTVNGYFQNVAANGLTEGGTFYDAIADVGSSELVLNVGAVNDFAARFKTIPALTITNSQRPYLETKFLFPGSSNIMQANLLERKYFGSAIFENDVPTPIAVAGGVTALGGDLGRMVLVGPATSGQYFPSSIPSTTLLSLNEDGPFGLPGIRQISGGADTINNPSPPAPPLVFIIDKIHTQDLTPDPTQSNTFDPRRIEPGDRFFIIGGSALPPIPALQGLPGALPGTVSRFAMSDGLDPQSFDGSGTQSVADQFLAPQSGSRPIAFSQYNAFRPEETFVAGAPRGYTHLLVISSADGRNPAMGADLQIAASGTNSASVSVGGITNFNGALALSGVTAGSAQLSNLDIQGQIAKGQIAITSNLGSTGTDASGLGAQMFGGSNRAPGQIGFFGVSRLIHV